MIETLPKPRKVDNLTANSAEQIRSRFNAWINQANISLSNLSNREILHHLRRLTDPGPITPETWNAGRRPVNPIAFENAYHSILAERDQVAEEINDNALLPPGTNNDPEDDDGNLYPVALKGGI